jgi:sulfotransferase
MHAKQFVFLGGMPRAGSTLLCNLLAQNPSVHATATSGCMDVMFGVRNNWDRLVEHRANPDRDANQRAKQRVLRAILDAYYAEIDRPIVIEKCRGWPSLIEMADAILERPATVIVPIRNVADVLASFEKMHRKRAALGQSSGEAENYFLFQTIAGRCEFWMRPDQTVGLAVNRILDAKARGFADRMVFVRFADLTHDPAATVRELYSRLGWESFEHNFCNIQQVTREDDTVHGFDGLHVIRSRIEPVKSDWRDILGPWAEAYSSIKLAGE